MPRRYGDYVVSDALLTHAGALGKGFAGAGDYLYKHKQDEFENQVKTANVGLGLFNAQNEKQRIDDNYENIVASQWNEGFKNGQNKFKNEQDTKTANRTNEIKATDVEYTYELGTEGNRIKEKDVDNAHVSDMLGRRIEAQNANTNAKHYENQDNVDRVKVIADLTPEPIKYKAVREADGSTTYYNPHNPKDNYVTPAPKVQPKPLSASEQITLGRYKRESIAQNTQKLRDHYGEYYDQLPKEQQQYAYNAYAKDGRFLPIDKQGGLFGIGSSPFIKEYVDEQETQRDIATLRKAGIK